MTERTETAQTQVSPARTFPPRIEPQHGRVVRGTLSRTYEVGNGLWVDPGYQGALIEVRRDGLDGHLIIEVYRGDAGVEVRCPAGVSYRFTGEER
jgi:hypothetical protein